MTMPYLHTRTVIQGRGCAAVHIKIQHKERIRNFLEIPDMRAFASEAFFKIGELAKDSPKGFRVIMRSGENGGQPPFAPLAIDFLGGEILRTTLKDQFKPEEPPMPSNVDEKLDENCVFCKIIKGPEQPVLDEDGVIVLRPVKPDAKEHLLFMPREHLRDITKVPEPEIFGVLFTKILRFAQGEENFKSGFQLISNNGPWGLQGVQHLHFHMLGGEKLESPFYQDWVVRQE